MEIIRDINDQLDHADILVGIKGIADKGHIKLQSVDRKMCQHPERRIAGAEVIHLDAESHAHTAKFPGGGNHLIGLAGICRFRNLKNDVIRCQRIGIENFLEHALEIRR